VADPVDPEFADLFRPDEDDPYDAGPSEPDAIDQIDKAPSPDMSGDGRLFRSQGVFGHADTVLAVPIGSRLKSLARTSDMADSADGADVPKDSRERVVPVTSTKDSSRSAELPRPPAPVEARPRREGAEPSEVEATTAFGSPAIPTFALWIIISSATLVFGFVNALTSSGHLGSLTGIALLLSTIASALLVRRSDLFLVVIAPPLMFGLAALTVGQFFLGSAGGLLNRLVEVFFTLGANWYWIVGSVVAAAVVLIVRRARSRR
jgi:hypothetical protein